MPNRSLLGQTRRKIIWPHEVKNWHRSNDSNRIKWPRTLWLWLLSPAHPLSKNASYSRLFSVKSLKLQEWNCTKKSSSRKSRNKKLNMKKEDMPNFQKPKNCKPKNSESRKSQKEEICSSKNPMIEKPGPRRNWSAEFSQNSTWKTWKTTQTEFWKNRAFSDNLSRPTFTRFIHHGFTSRSFQS